jgi:pimeloyl-ACP methyl ester carboxylesterase
VTIDYSPGAVGREQRVTNEMVRSRYRSVDADHAIVVLTGNTSRPGIVDSFCVHHAGRGVDVWKLDTRFSPNGWSDDVADWGARIAQTTRLPLFMVGSARSAADVYRALDISDVFVGAVVIVDASPPVLPNPLDPSLRQNAKPVAFVLGESDIDSWPEVARAAAAANGPVEWHTLRDDVDGLMPSRPDACSDVVLEWCLRQLSNHFNPTWRFH